MKTTVLFSVLGGKAMSVITGTTVAIMKYNLRQNAYRTA